jgi:hypothetical protein
VDYVIFREERAKEQSAALATEDDICLGLSLY